MPEIRNEKHQFVDNAKLKTFNSGEYFYLLLEVLLMELKWELKKEFGTADIERTFNFKIIH